MVDSNEQNGWTAESLDGWPQLLEGKQIFVLFSGGKDSAAALLYTKEAVRGMNPNPMLEALHVDTTIGFPPTEEYVRHFCDLLGVRLTVVRPKNDYFALARKWGIPRPRARWCCFYLKIQPIRDYLRMLPNNIVVDGIRRAESKKRSEYPLLYQHRHFGLVVHPIIDWSAEEVDGYLKSNGLPVNPAYDLGCGSWECWCGLNKRESEFRQLKKVNPELFDKLVGLESEMRSGFAYGFYSGKSFYLKDL